MKRGLVRVLLVAAACSGVGCSSFEREWSREGAAVERVVAVDRGGRGPEGRWIGSWRSDRSGHTGALRCLVRRPADGAGEPAWRFHYHARWLGVMSAAFQTRQPVEATGRGRFVSQGTWTVPRWAGGAYQYDIEITETEFRGRFRSGGEHGTFAMTRLPAR